MRISTASIPILTGLIVSICLCQTSAIGPEVLAAYDVFFQNLFAADHLAACFSCKVAPDAKLLSLPKLQEAIGLTDEEMQIVRAQATAYQTKAGQFQVAVAPLRQEALLQSIESGHVSENLAQRIGQLQNEYTKTASDQIQELKTALGTSRFELLDKFVHLRTSK